MTYSEFIEIGIDILDILKISAPKDTGNLAFNSIKMEAYEDRIIIYVDLAIAPYMPYTNEPWLSARWHGKKNPNENWFDNVVKDRIVPYIVEKTGGILK